MDRVAIELLADQLPAATDPVEIQPVETNHLAVAYSPLYICFLDGYVSFGHLVTATMKALEKIVSPIGQRNLLFAVICTLGLGVVFSSLLQSDTVTPLRNHSAERYQKPEFRDVVERVDAEFVARWEKEGLEPAPPADELTRIRRLSLGLTGTLPALQEIRAIEEARDFYAGNQPPPNNHIQWWLSHLFEDRRTSDYLAERFARAYVGVENGPFLVYRRRRFVSWLSDQFTGTSLMTRLYAH